MSEPLCFEHAGASEWRHHPAYKALGIECYIGAKLAGAQKVHGTICFVGPDPRATPFTEADKDFLLLMARWISGELDRQQSDQRLGKINECFLSFGADPLANINRLTALCGELLGGTCALYSRLEGELLCSIGQWQAPPDFNPVDKAEGHLCCDLIRQGTESLFTVRHLPDTSYAETDPNVSRYELQTYVGKIVRRGTDPVGSLCVVYQRDVIPTEADERLMGILASAIGTEEERMRAQKALSDSETRFKIAFRSSPHPVIVTELATGRCLEVNDASLKLFGYSREEVIGRTTLTLGIWPTPEDRAQFFQQIQTEGAIRNREISLRAKDRTPRQLLVSSEVIDFDGTPGLLTVGNDISDRKRAEKALQDNQARLHEAERIAKMGHWYMDMATNTLSWSAGKYRIFGVTPETFSPALENILAMTHPDDVLTTTRTLEELAQRHQPATWDFRIIRPDGAMRTICCTGEARVDQSGKLVAMIGTALDITERKQTEAALRESDERFAKAFRSSPYPIVISEMESGLCLDANDAAIHLFGYRRDEVAGKTADQIGLWPTADHRLQFIRQLRETGAIRNVETALRTKSGEFRHCLISAEHIELNGKHCMVTIGYDVTEQRRAEQALRLTQFAVDHGADMAFWIDSSARLLYVNDAACQRLGYTREELLSMTVADIDVDYQLAAWPQHWDKLRQEGRLRFESRQRSKSGDIYPTEIVANFVSFEGKEYNFAFVRDISDQKQTELALRDSEARLYRFVADAPVGLVILDTERRVINANKAFCELTGYAEHEVLGSTYALYTHHDDLAANLTLTDEFYRGERSDYTYEKRYVRKSGDVIWVSVKATRMELPGHRGPLLLAAVQDITEQKRATEEREQLSQDLHDNILQSLYAVGMQMEAGKLVVGKSPRKSKAHMTQAINQLNHLVLEVRQFITLLTQRSAAKPNFGQALRQLVASFSTAGEAAPELEIKESMLSKLTPAQGEQLLSIVREALSNSMRHAQAGHRWVRLSHMGNTIRLVVCDDGVGFTAKQRPRRGHGLANMAARAKKIHARFTLDSAPGKGTCITVDVPEEKGTLHA